jgi:hypothetical protein
MMNRIRDLIESRIHNYAHNARDLEPEESWMMDVDQFVSSESYRQNLVLNMTDENLLDLFEALVEKEHKDKADTLSSMIYGVGL